eukprot:1597162-Rhodomonas_salina.1
MALRQHEQIESNPYMAAQPTFMASRQHQRMQTCCSISAGHSTPPGSAIHSVTTGDIAYRAHMQLPGKPPYTASSAYDPPTRRFAGAWQRHVIRQSCAVHRGCTGQYLGLTNAEASAISLRSCLDQFQFCNPSRDPLQWQCSGSAIDWQASQPSFIQL